MPYRNPLDNIVLTCLTSKNSFDVICFHSQVSWDAFKTYVAALGIGYEIISPATAAKILLAQGGVGYGCYTMDGTHWNYSKEEEYRKALAASKKKDIGAIIGICSIFEPLKISSTDVGVQRPEARPKLSIKA